MRLPTSDEATYPLAGLVHYWTGWVDGWMAAGEMGVKTKSGKLGLCLAKTTILFGRPGGSQKSTIILDQASLA